MLQPLEPNDTCMVPIIQYAQEGHSRENIQMVGSIGPRYRTPDLRLNHPMHSTHLHWVWNGHTMAELGCLRDDEEIKQLPLRTNATQ
jgi:hypothetical protein